MPSPIIEPLTVEHAAACDAVIASLPYFFGDPTGVSDCAEAVRSQRGWVALLDGAVAGFLTLHFHNDESAEITWMAVRADHRRHGIGRMLIDAACVAASNDGARMLCVLTLGPSEDLADENNGDNYEGTRRFYRTNGFIPLRELGLREWNNTHALILVRALDAR
jgi:ribosomal protein S18 acetylase RimI-like enzyme